MKLVLVGAHGVGKTEAARRVAELTDYAIVSSTSRDVYEMGREINQSASPETQAMISMGRIAQCLSAGDDYISDRSPLDSMAYNRFQLENMWADAEPVAAKYWYEKMDVITKHAMLEYDVIIYVPITFPLVADGVRPTDIEYQREIDSHVRDFLDQYGLLYYTMPTGTVEERAQWIVRKVIG